MVLILNDIGGMEILLILAFILIFFGSKSIIGLARTFGRTIRQIKDASADLQAEIKKSSNELKGELNLKEIIDDTARDIQKPLDQYASDIEEAVNRKPSNSLPTKKKRIDTPPELEVPKAPKSPKIPEAPKLDVKKASDPASDAE